jgi:predicted RND superfamily exporter protein
MVKSAPDQCARYQTLNAMSELQWQLDNLPEVQSSHSLADYARWHLSANNEGSLKWMALNRNQLLLNAATIKPPEGLLDDTCALAPILVYLNDHKADTLNRVIDTIEAFVHTHQLNANAQNSAEFLLAAGSAGIEATTNRVIAAAEEKMLLLEYGVVGLIILLTYRSFRALLCVMLPLVLTSVLCQALMAQLGIGIKVATLPVIALGVGIGVDYGIYIYSKLLSYLQQGLSLQKAYLQTLQSTGKAVAFTGITLAIGVGTWLFSPIKCQADMGLLLAFIFLWNMVGAMLLLPALAFYLVQPLYPPLYPQQQENHPVTAAGLVSTDPAPR